MIQTPQDVAEKMLDVAKTFGKEKDKEVRMFTCDVYEIFPTPDDSDHDLGGLKTEDLPAYTFQVNVLYNINFLHPFHEFADNLRTKFLKELRFTTVDRRVVTGNLGLSSVRFDNDVIKKNNQKLVIYKNIALLEHYDIAASNSILELHTWPEFHLSRSLYPEGTFSELSYYAYDKNDPFISTFIELYPDIVHEPGELEL